MRDKTVRRLILRDVFDKKPNDALEDCIAWAKQVMNGVLDKQVVGAATDPAMVEKWDHDVIQPLRDNWCTDVVAPVPEAVEVSPVAATPSVTDLPDGHVVATYDDDSNSVYYLVQTLARVDGYAILSADRHSGGRDPSTTRMIPAAVIAAFACRLDSSQKPR